MSSVSVGRTVTVRPEESATASGTVPVSFLTPELVGIQDCMGHRSRPPIKSWARIDRLLLIMRSHLSIHFIHFKRQKNPK